MPLERLVDTLRMSSFDLDQLICRLERDGPPTSTNSKRASKRWRAQTQKVAVTTHDEQGGKRTLIMAPRNISTGGMGLLHGGFLHPGTVCAIVLRDVRGKAMQIAGSVTRCSHLQGTIHELGVKFDQRINPRDYFIWAGNDYLFNAESVTPGQLSGTVLIVNDSPADQRLISHLLRGTALEFIYARTGEDGLEMLEQAPHIALVDYQLPDMDGLTLVTAARSRGCTTPMLLLSGCPDQELRHAAIGAGAKEMLFKPLSEALLHKALAEYLLLGDIQRRDDDPFRASAAHASSESIESCIEEIRASADKLLAMMAANNLEQLTASLGRLHGAAADFGFKALHLRTQIAMQKISGIERAEDAAFDISRVVEACRMARGPL